MTDQPPTRDSLQRVGRRFREWVSREVKVSDVAEWWEAGWMRAKWKHCDEMVFADGIIWKNRTKRRLHRLLAFYCKRREASAWRRKVAAREQEETFTTHCP